MAFNVDGTISALERKMSGTGLTNRELEALKGLREQQASNSYGINAEMAKRGSNAASAIAPPSLDYRALKSLADLQEAQSKAADSDRAAQMQSDLDNVHSSYYDATPKDGGPKDQIMISMGDVVDPAKEGVPPVAGMKSIGGKLFLPPPALDEDAVRRMQNREMRYDLNESGRQARASLGQKPAPPEIPENVRDMILQRGGNVNPATGGFTVQAPEAPKVDPLLLAAGKQNIANSSTPEEVGAALNEAQTSASLSLPPMAPPPMQAPAMQGARPFSDQQPQRVDEYRNFLASAMRAFPNKTEAEIRQAYFAAGGE